MKHLERKLNIPRRHRFRASPSGGVNRPRSPFFHHLGDHSFHRLKMIDCGGEVSSNLLIMIPTERSRVGTF